MNDHLILICGESATGKSASLRTLKNPEGIAYLNCEAGKKTPFRSKFREFVITDPYQVLQAFDELQDKEEFHTIIIDGLNYLMDMYESMYVLTAKDTRTAWSHYAQFFKELMQSKVASSNKNIIITAHTKTLRNEVGIPVETKVPLKGSLGNQGAESYFSQIVSCKRVRVEDLEQYQNSMLSITEEEKALGFKYVFQTKITKDTVHERIRSPMGLFESNETFMDNDAQRLLDRLHEYYD